MPESPGPVIRQLTSSLSVAGQIAETDLPMIASQGFRAIVNNRPDDEAPGQPAAAALARAAERLGLAYRHVPARSGQLTDADVAAFARALAELPGPVLAFCRSGTRSTTLWALGATGGLSPDDILRIAAEAGFDLAAIRARLGQHAAMPRQV